MWKIVWCSGKAFKGIAHFVWRSVEITLTVPLRNLQQGIQLEMLGIIA